MFVFLLGTTTTQICWIAIQYVCFDFRYEWTYTSCPLRSPDQVYSVHPWFCPVMNRLQARTCTVMCGPKSPGSSVHYHLLRAIHQTMRKTSESNPLRTSYVHTVLFRGHLHWKVKLGACYAIEENQIFMKRYVNELCAGFGDQPMCRVLAYWESNRAKCCRKRVSSTICIVL